MDFSAQRLKAIQETIPIGFQTQVPRSNFMNQPSASQKSTIFRGARQLAGADQSLFFGIFKLANVLASCRRLKIVLLAR